ncbi:hypothetical protein B0H17DRAFT_1147525 [Mycena rosella]|uniref:Uncharacterized protein n=1 Tax=Mycena rosella TaxID=1033263 RepID=A0AAD7CLJ0_MYCRO|nr:hypothetical protein B0H17DRAFT_1147525 [Mycena rosella]
MVQLSWLWFKLKGEALESKGIGSIVVPSGDVQRRIGRPTLPPTVPTMGAQSTSISIPGAIQMTNGVEGDLRVEIATICRKCTEEKLKATGMEVINCSRNIRRVRKKVTWQCNMKNLEHAAAAGI